MAQSYFLAIEAGLQLEVAQKSLNALTQTDEIVQAQRDIGVASGLDVALSQRDLANALDAVLEAEGGQRIALRALETLLGRYPGGLVETRPALPQTPPPPPAGLPSSLLERRPDLIAAELSVAAAYNSVSAARAARLPTISLTSSINGSSTELSDILDPENVAWQVAGNLLGPLFDGGLRKGAVDQASAQQQAATAAYAQAAIDAFQEVETSLDQNTVLRAREKALADAATQANRAFEIAQIRYEEGETDLLDVLTIQSSAFAADSALVTVQRALLDEWINLNLALGGDWRAGRCGLTLIAIALGKRLKCKCDSAADFCFILSDFEMFLEQEQFRQAPDRGFPTIKRRGQIVARAMFVYVAHLGSPIRCHKP